MSDQKEDSAKTLREAEKLVRSILPHANEETVMRTAKMVAAAVPPATIDRLVAEQAEKK